MDNVPLNEIEKYLKHAPKLHEMRLDECTIIRDVDAFIESHLSILKANPGNARYMPDYKRLLTLYYKVKELNNG